MKNELELTVINSDDINYRIVEKNSIFYIQKKIEYEEKSGFFWNKKITNKVKWEYLDKEGNSIFYVKPLFKAYQNYVEEYDSLSDAFTKLDDFLKGTTYHYKNK